jgi:hypothetical protein
VGSVRPLDGQIGPGSQVPRARWGWGGQRGVSHPSDIHGREHRGRPRSAAVALARSHTPSLSLSIGVAIGSPSLPCCTAAVAWSSISRCHFFLRSAILIRVSSRPSRPACLPSVVKQTIKQQKHTNKQTNNHAGQGVSGRFADPANRGALWAVIVYCRYRKYLIPFCIGRKNSVVRCSKPVWKKMQEHELLRSSSFSLSSAVAMCWIGPEFGVVLQFGLVFWFSHQLLGRSFVGEKEICALWASFDGGNFASGFWKNQLLVVCRRIIIWRRKRVDASER